MDCMESPSGCIKKSIRTAVRDRLLREYKRNVKML